MKNNERLIYFFDLHIDVNKKAASPPSARDVFNIVESAFRKSEARLHVNKKTATIQIIDLRFDDVEEIVTLYVRYADKRGADVYFADTDANTSRVERKKFGEGRGFGAHLSVSLRPEAGSPNTYLAMLEKANGVNSSLVLRLLQSIFRELYRSDENLFTCDDISGARDRAGVPKKVGFRPMLELKGLPSEQFISDLEEGSLQEIHLIEDKEKKQFGAHPWLHEKQNVVRLTPGAGVPGVAQLWGNLKTVFSAEAKNGYKKARIKFRRADGQPDTVEVDAETGALLDQRYVKAKRIGDVDPVLDECADAIVPHFAELVEAELIANRK
ncbi:hypothetical protein [Ensifer canadensis]